MDLEQAVAELGRLADRVARLERDSPAAAPSSADAALARQLLSDLEADPERATVVYAGAGVRDDGAVAWQMDRSWDDVLALATDAGIVLAALGSPTRIAIVVQLLAGAVTTGELTRRLDQPSSGQLFHHLKELLAAGVVHQPLRGTYAIRHQHVVPLLAVLSAATDLASTQGGADPT
jgi:DNA-binding transcriptional ArsR family regulator